MNTNGLLEAFVLIAGSVVIATAFYWLGRKDGTFVGYRFGWVDGIRESEKFGKGSEGSGSVDN